jgi:hypothetical protein
MAYRMLERCTALKFYHASVAILGIFRASAYYCTLRSVMVKMVMCTIRKS